MSEIIEKAASAFALASTKIERDVRVSEMTGEEIAMLVRAVLTAIREPSDAMVKAGKDAFVSCGDYRVDSDEAWRLMIDAALATT